MLLKWNLDQQLKVTRGTKHRQKIYDAVMPANFDVIAIFQIMANLEQSERRITEV